MSVEWARFLVIIDVQDRTFRFLFLGESFILGIRNRFAEVEFELMHRVLEMIGLAVCLFEYKVGLLGLGLR